MTLPWFCLMGPTASGKTALACELIQHFPFEIISIDSVMIYREMNIGSAKPDAMTLADAPHHLIDIIDPTDTYSAAQCCEDVLRCGRDIEARGNIPLLVGGTMMYFRALQQGLSLLPASDPKIRSVLMYQAKELGWDVMHQRLQQIDPESAARIHHHDTQRILRALEIYELTQKPMSYWWKATQTQSAIDYVNLLLMPQDRSWLHARIAERFLQMMEAGLINEVRDLIQTWSLTAEHPAMRCVGYRQVWTYLHDHQDQSLLIEQGMAATRQLAKRQLTWLRHWPDGHNFVCENPNNLGEMIALIGRIADNDSE
ncbi:MAG: tRNA (adenosine(37)-N6)-dimethylallyltransferase MiaA [Legionella sp.]|nr:MAG: tRNA (adenosine(37)-N6)-dimethylallyltransferase MiaA [Legionella sp.]